MKSIYKTPAAETIQVKVEDVICGTGQVKFSGQKVISSTLAPQEGGGTLHKNGPKSARSPHSAGYLVQKPGKNSKVPRRGTIIRTCLGRNQCAAGAFLLHSRK